MENTSIRQTLDMWLELNTVTLYHRVLHSFQYIGYCVIDFFQMQMWSLFYHNLFRLILVFPKIENIKFVFKYGQDQNQTKFSLYWKLESTHFIENQICLATFPRMIILFKMVNSAYCRKSTNSGSGGGK